MTYKQFKTRTIGLSLAELRCDVPPTQTILDLFDDCAGKMEAFVARFEATATEVEKAGYRYFGQLSSEEQAGVRKQLGGWSEIDLCGHAWRKSVGSTANGKVVVTWSSHYSA